MSSKIDILKGHRKILLTMVIAIIISLNLYINNVMKVPIPERYAVLANGNLAIVAILLTILLFYIKKIFKF